MSEPFGGATRAIAEPQLRFLRAIADRVAVERVAEVYLFPPMRQGHVESGVGVVAVLPEAEAVAAATDGDQVDADDERLEGEAGEPQLSLDAVAFGEQRPELEVVDDRIVARSNATRRNDRADSRAIDAEGSDQPVGELADPPEPASESGEAVDPNAASHVGDAGPTADDAPSADGAPPRRHDGSDVAAPTDHFAAGRDRTPRTGGRRSTIFSARYRLTLKGPDRGKWEVDVRAEADAPLITVDAVIRGIQRRAPGEADAERLTGDAFRALLSPAT